MLAMLAPKILVWNHLRTYENTVSTQPLYRVESLDWLYSVQWIRTKNSRYFNPYNKNSVHNMVIKRSLLGAQSKHYLLTLLMPSPLHRISINCANPLKSQTSFSTGRPNPGLKLRHSHYLLNTSFSNLFQMLWTLAYKYHVAQGLVSPSRRLFLEVTCSIKALVLVEQKQPWLYYSLKGPSTNHRSTNKSNISCGTSYSAQGTAGIPTIPKLTLL